MQDVKMRARERYEIIRLFKSTEPCADCGQCFPPECMDFDHVRGKKEFGIGASAGRYGVARVEAEIAKCDLVCANCHRIRTRQRRK